MNIQKHISLLLLCSCLLVLGQAHAQIYKWVDENGKVHYSDKKPRDQQVDVETEDIKTGNSLNGSVGGMPTVAIRSAIPYEKTTPSRTVKLDILKVALSGSEYNDVPIGSVYSGANCQNKRSDLVWTSGNTYMDDRSNAQTLHKQFQLAGYSTDQTLSRVELAGNRLQLKITMKELIIKKCARSNSRYGNSGFSESSSNDVYMQLNWELEDHLAQRVIYEKSTKGIYKGFSQVPRSNGTTQTINRALAVATNNLLADQEFVSLLDASETKLVDRKNNTPLPLPLSYTSDRQTSFKNKLEYLRNTAVTIRTSGGHGSGVIVTQAGEILTNHHVIEGNDEILVIVGDKEYKAKVVRVEPIRDVALLKLENSLSLSQLPEISNLAPSVGDTIFAIGTPLSESLSHTVTSGIISAERETNGLPYFQTDAAINPGNSGGPIYDEYGNLVGLSVAGILSKSGGNMGLNYLIPIFDALAALNIENGGIAQEQVQQTTAAASPQKQRATARNARPVKPQQSEIKTIDPNGKNLPDAIYFEYKKALAAKESGDFNKAKTLLENAVGSLSYDDRSKEAWQVRDELHYFLPMEIAKKAIKDGKAEAVFEQVAHMNRYVSDHPKRFDYTRRIEELVQSAKYLEDVIKASALNDLSPVRVFIKEYFLTTGDIPTKLNGMQKLLDKQLGRSLSNRYTLIDYNLQNGIAVFVFKSVITNKQSTVQVRL